MRDSEQPMNVARAQEQAERMVRLLLVVHGLATLALILLVNLLATLCWMAVFGVDTPVPTGFHVVNAGGVVLVVWGGAWLEMRRLADDSAHVARRLGACAIDASGQRLHRRLQNVLEELAIGARIGVPRAFVLQDEPTINALAAGLDRNQSVVIVTQGALERLTREELQGVLAHEVAHIVQGDVRLNTRLLGMNQGLRWLAELGRDWLTGWWRVCEPHTLRQRVLGAWRGTTANPAGGGLGWLVLAVPGLILLGVGSVGEWFARAITAGVGRQREYQADAQAIAWTRHPDGLGGALRKVMGLGEALRREGLLASGLDPRRAVQRRHPAWLACAHLMWVGSSSSKCWFATHPPSHERARRIYGHPVAARLPHRLVEPDESEPQWPTLAWDGGGALAPTAQSAGDWTDTVAVNPPDHGQTQVMPHRAPWDDTLIQAAQLAWPVPQAAMRLLQATREPHGAAALVMALLQARSAQMPLWGAGWSASVHSAAALRAAMGELPEVALQPLRWPLVELAVTRLRTLSKPMREALLATARGVVAGQGPSALREWGLYGLLRLRLTPLRGPVASLDARGVRVLFALLGQALDVREARIDRAANATIRSLDLAPIGGMAGPLTLEVFERAMMGAARLPIRVRARLVRELMLMLPPDPPVDLCDFLRFVCLAIDCGPPPLPTSQRLTAA